MNYKVNKNSVGILTKECLECGKESHFLEYSCDHCDMIFDKRKEPNYEKRMLMLSSKILEEVNEINNKLREK